jgi:hypothetical protein
MVPAHDKDASEIIIATVTVDHDSEYHFTLCLRSICSRSPAQLEARSTSLVDTFSSRAELRGLSRFPPSSCRARARIRRVRNQDRDHNGHDQLSVMSLPNPFPKLTARARSQVRSRRDTVTDAAAAAQHTAVTVVIGGRTAARWRARCGSGG